MLILPGEAFALSYVKELRWNEGILLKIPKGWTSTSTTESSDLGYRSDFYLDFPDRTKKQASIGKMVFTKIDNYTEYFGDYNKFTTDYLAKLQTKPGFKLKSDKDVKFLRMWRARKLSYTYQNEQDPSLIETHVDLIGTIEKNLQIIEFYTIEPANQSGKSQFQKYAPIYRKILTTARRMRIIQGVPILY